MASCLLYGAVLLLPCEVLLIRCRGGERYALPYERVMTLYGHLLHFACHCYKSHGGHTFTVIVVIATLGHAHCYTRLPFRHYITHFTACQRFVVIVIRAALLMATLDIVTIYASLPLATLRVYRVIIESREYR